MGRFVRRLCREHPPERDVDALPHWTVPCECLEVDVGKCAPESSRPDNTGSDCDDPLFRMAERRVADVVLAELLQEITIRADAERRSHRVRDCIVPVNC